MRFNFFPFRSISARLFLSAAASSAIVLLIASFFITAYYRREAEDVFERRLDVYLRAIIADVSEAGEDGHLGPGQLGDPKFELPGSGWYWQITRVDDAAHEIKASRSLFVGVLPKLSDLGVTARSGGFRHGNATGPDGRDLRIVERVIDAGEIGVYLVQVAASTEEMDEQIARFGLGLATAFATLAIALAGVAAFQVRFGLRPLKLLQQELNAIGRGEKDRIAGDYPSEVAPLVDEANALIGANRDILERARLQVGNLAHALKTPLSVLINEADASPSSLADKVSEQAKVMHNQISFYLDRARAAARGATLGASTPVEPCAAGLLRAFNKIYQDRSIIFSSDIDQDLRFLGERQDLEEMIGNLLDNAGKWAQHTVTLKIHPQRSIAASNRFFLEITIDDDGPGLDAHLRQQATQRGQRIDESKPGSGLGLAIVLDLAAAYGGSLKLEDSPSGGLRARLSLPGF